MQLRISPRVVAWAVICWLVLYSAAYLYYINSENLDENGQPMTDMSLKELLNIDTSMSGIRAGMSSALRMFCANVLAVCCMSFPPLPSPT